MVAKKFIHDYPEYLPAEVLAADNLKLRRMLALQVAGGKLYTDDGELSDSSDFPAIDFLRDTPDFIREALIKRNQRKL